MSTRTSGSSEQKPRLTAGETLPDHPPRGRFGRTRTSHSDLQAPAVTQQPRIVRVWEVSAADAAMMPLLSAGGACPAQRHRRGRGVRRGT